MTRKQLLPGLVVLCGLAFPTAASAANQTVTANGLSQFVPASVSLSQGESVTWNNVSGIHNVHFDDNSYIQPPSAQSAPWTVARTFSNTGTFGYYCDLHGGPGGLGMSGTVTVTAVAYPRPGAATPLRVPLSPEYRQCTTPNSTHATPSLDGTPATPDASCTPPQRESNLLTTAVNGAGGGFARLRVIAGDPLTGPDEADVGITASATVVRRTSDNMPYTGRAILATQIRITDMANGASGTGSATVQDAKFALPVDCTSGTCSLNTTADTLVPGFAKEGKRAIVETFSVNLKDAGPDASIGPTSCGPNCGTGDERVFLSQAVFVP